MTRKRIAFLALMAVALGLVAVPASSHEVCAPQDDGPVCINADDFPLAHDALDKAHDVINVANNILRNVGVKVDPITGEYCSMLPPEEHGFPGLGGDIDGKLFVGAASWTFIYHYCYWQHQSGAQEVAYGYAEIKPKTTDGWSYNGTDTIYNYIGFYPGDNCYYFKYRGDFSFMGTVPWQPENDIDQFCLA